jgi:hypothetical protein
MRTAEIAAGVTSANVFPLVAVLLGDGGEGGVGEGEDDGCLPDVLAVACMSSAAA